MAWTYDSGEEGGLQTNPIVVGRTLYTTTPLHRTVALDAATGAVRWTFDSGFTSRGPNRGVTYWTDGRSARIFAAADHYVYALDARDRQADRDVRRATAGSICTKASAATPEQQSVRLTTPGVIYKDLLIVGGRVDEGLPASPGDIRAYRRPHRRAALDASTPSRIRANPALRDVAEGRLDDSGGANNWAGMAVDTSARHRLRADRLGGRRTSTAPTASGDNLYANTLLALDAATGKRLWHFQAVQPRHLGSRLPVAADAGDGARTTARRDRCRGADDQARATCSSSIARPGSRCSRSRSGVPGEQRRRGGHRADAAAAGRSRRRSPASG